MDAPQNEVSQVPKVETPPTTGAVQVSKKNPLTKKLLMILGVLVLLAGAAYGGYWWRDRDAKSDSEKISALSKQIEELEANNSAAGITESDMASVQPSEEQLQNIKDSISSGNTAALEGRMASSVMVIIAASEGVGVRTPEQAISDIDYVIDLDATWDFALPSTTLDAYAAGDYAQYFTMGALVGKSSTDKVISFIFDTDAKIKTVFMSASSDIL